IGVLFSCRFNPFHSVWEAAVFEVFPSHIVEGFGTVRCAPSAYLYHYEAQSRELMQVTPSICHEVLRYERVMWTSIDVFYHRVLLFRVEVRRTNDHAPDIGAIISTGSHENFWENPPRLKKVFDVC